MTAEEESITHPFVTWGQNETHVFLSAQLMDAQNVHVDIEDETLKFSSLGNGAHGRVTYTFNIDYYLPVIAKQSRFTVTARAVIIKLRKEYRETWPRLTVGVGKLPWARLDFDLYQFDASDLEQSDNEGGGPGEVEVKVIHPSKEERERHNAEMKELEDEDDWEAFLNVVKNPLTIYLVLFNLFQFAGFIFVFGTLMVTYLWPPTGASPQTPFGTKWYEETVTRLIIVQLVAFLEPVHAALGWVRGSAAVSLMQNCGRSLVLFFIILPHPNLHSTSTVFWLFFAWSSIELVRYPTYVASLLSFKFGLLTYLRYTLWIPLYPIGFICEGKLIVWALPQLQASGRFSLPMPNRMNMSFDFAVFLHIYIIVMLPAFYRVMRYMYVRRRRVLGPSPRIGADQMGFFSYIPFLRSLVNKSMAQPTATERRAALATEKRRQLVNQSSLSKLA